MAGTRCHGTNAGKDGASRSHRKAPDQREREENPSAKGAGGDRKRREDKGSSERNERGEPRQKQAGRQGQMKMTMR